MDQPLGYDESVARYVGQLFLETRHRLESKDKEVQDLRSRLAQAEQERDNALSLIGKVNA